jgi:hypothetical protein
MVDMLKCSRDKLVMFILLHFSLIFISTITVYKHASADLLYLIGYRSSDVLLRYPARLLAETWSRQQLSSGAHILPNQDLHQSVPAYMISGDYLVKLLGQIYNKDPDTALFACYASWTQIETAFRNQLVLYTRGLSPFH